MDIRKRCVIFALVIREGIKFFISKVMESNLLSTYLSYHNLVITPKQKGAKPDGNIFMPMLLMDAMNVVYINYIAKLPLKHKEKQIRTRWHEAYGHFIKQELMAFNDDQKCDICDLMNAFVEYINNEVSMFRVAVMEKFMQYDTEVRLVLSATLACNVLAQSAQIIWKSQRLKENTYIASMEEWSNKFLSEYATTRIDRKSKAVDLNTFESIRTTSTNICKKVVEFAKSLEF